MGIHEPDNVEPIEQCAAVKRGMEMLRVPMKDLPPLAVEFARHLCSQLGGCIEVFLTAYAVYAQCVEGKVCEDDLYLVRPAHAEWFALRGHTKDRGVFSE